MNREHLPYLCAKTFNFLGIPVRKYIVYVAMLIQTWNMRNAMYHICSIKNKWEKVCVDGRALDRMLNENETP